MPWSDVQGADVGSSQAAHVLLADLKIAPGMEGGPVLNAEGHMVGVLTVPLCHRHFQAEVRREPTVMTDFFPGERQSWNGSAEKLMLWGACMHQAWPGDLV